MKIKKMKEIVLPELSTKIGCSDPNCKEPMMKGKGWLDLLDKEIKQEDLIAVRSPHSLVDGKIVKEFHVKKTGTTSGWPNKEWLSDHLMVVATFVEGASQQQKVTEANQKQLGAEVNSVN